MRLCRLALRDATSRRTLSVAILSLLLVLAATPRPTTAQSLPDRLSDAEFWRIISDISEPGGYFRLTDNFTSNEMEVAQVAGMLKDRGVSSGAYIGVGPEQNFTYIATMRPTVAFVIDIRRQAVVQHLMFKALFELSRDRGEFISLLFSRPRPMGIDSTTSIGDVWTLFTPVQTDSALATRTRKRVFDHLLRAHKFALTDEEGLMLNWVMEAFTGTARPLRRLLARADAAGAAEIS